MKFIQEIKSVQDMIQDWDSNWNEALLYQSEEKNWSEKQKIEFLYKEELKLRKTLESLFAEIVNNSHSEELFENVKFIFTDVELGIRSLAIDQLIDLHKQWVIDNFLDEDIFNKEFDSLFKTLNKEIINKHFMVLQEEICILVSLCNSKSSRVLSSLRPKLLELINLDLVEFFKNALFETEEFTLHPLNKKTLKEIQVLKKGNSQFTRIVTWRSGELHLDLKTGEIKLGHCFEKCDVEYDQECFENEEDLNSAEGDILDELNSKGFELVDSWFEIDGVTKFAINCFDQGTDL